MIAKNVKGRGFRGALEYDLGKEKDQKGYVLDTNMAGETPRELAGEFGQIRKLRPNLERAVLHVSISASPEDQVSDDQWRKIAQRYLSGMGFVDNQYVVSRHTDTEHPHIHILANRITHGGTVVSDSLDYRRQETLMREIERDYGLTPVAPSKESQRKAPTKGEIEEGIRTGEASTRMRLQQLADVAARDCSSLGAYCERLNEVGVDIIPVIQREGAKVAGMSYRLDNVIMKGSDLGRGYTPTGLAKRGITYEQDRDLAAIRRSEERAASATAGRAGAGVESTEPPQRGRAGPAVGAVGTSHGELDRRDPQDLGRDRAQQQGAERGVRESAQERNTGAGGRAGESQPGRAAVGEGGIQGKPESLPLGDGERGDYGGARERLVALAGVAGVAGNTGSVRDQTGGAGRVGASEVRADRSLEALQKQVGALGADAYDIELRNPRTGAVQRRTWRPDELTHSAAWFKRMNARGHDVLVRPAGEHGLVMVGNLPVQALARMKQDGLAPAAVIEARPGRFEAWVKVSELPVPVDARVRLEKAMAGRYGGVAGGGNPGQPLGRLAGFTNQDSELTRDGSQPYVLAHASTGEVASQGPKLVREVINVLDREAAKRESQARQQAIEATPDGRSRDLAVVYRQYAKQVLRGGTAADDDKFDERIAVALIKSGYDAQKIEQCIEGASPHVVSVKDGAMARYGKDVVHQAQQSPQIAAFRLEQQQQERQRQLDREQDRKQDRGMSL